MADSSKRWGYLGVEIENIPEKKKAQPDQALDPAEAPTRKGRVPTGRKRLTQGERGRRRRALQRAVVDAVTCDDLADVTRAMVEKAKQGDVNAARLVFDRLLGRLPTESTKNVNVFEDKALAVHFQNMSLRELEQLERELLNPSIEAEAKVIN